ncbi:hypothetical protein UG56_019980 [Nocardioides luteus]|uniref:Uncharacterized protein n=1 Tax=Nocardioides luteus TaxID=1844 RepID=A0A1J4N3T4_9ACTN|nr:hypothetical protein UG56_019980 [Nocardioides luteus]
MCQTEKMAAGNAECGGEAGVLHADLDADGAPARDRKAAQAPDGVPEVEAGDVVQDDGEHQAAFYPYRGSFDRRQVPVSRKSRGREIGAVPCDVAGPVCSEMARIVTTVL